MEGQPHTGVTDAAFTQRLAAICGPEHVISDATTLNVYRSDALNRYQQAPALAVLPGDAQQVAAVVRACAEQGISWVARGAGTGLSGGAVPHPGGLLIVLSRLRRIHSVDLTDARIVVEPGVTNEAVSRAVAPTHFYPPDPSSRVVCTIGGNVAENAGGAHGFKYGFTTDYVIGLDVVLPDGSLVELRRNRPGYDLIGAFVGSEGTLGVAVAIHLRVVPVPESIRTMIGFFDSPAQAARAVSHLITAGLAPSAVELMDALSMRAIEEIAEAGYRTDAGASLLIEFDGPRDDCAAGLEAAVGLCARAGARDIRVALDDDERERLWQTRAAAFAAMRRLSRAFYVQDGVIPRSRLAQVLERVALLSSEFGLAVATVVHAGDGNLHPVILFDPSSATETTRATELAERILTLCVHAGGSISGEHGVGLDKVALMPSMFAAADLAAFEHLRTAFDPRGLANPGKLTPATRPVRA